jgi:hypothetical protein
MPEATILIPKRWEKGLNQIKMWVEHYTSTVGQPLTVIIGGEWDSGEIWISDPTHLTSAQYTALKNAVHEINERLNFLHEDAWKAKLEAQTKLKEDLDVIQRLLDQYQ